MTPLQIEFQAFGPYPDHEKVDFRVLSRRGLFLICGKTGTGKTMILDAMTFALYGKSSGNSRDDFESLRCTRAGFEKSTFVKFEFENNGSYYIFERRLERKRKNLSPSYSLLEKDDNGVYQPLYENTREKDLNQKAVEIIGLDYDQFRQVVILPQGQFERLLTSKSEEKEKILSNIFGEDTYQKISTAILEEVTCRRDDLRDRKNRMLISLGEDGCDSLLQLGELISSCKRELKELEADFQKADYDSVLKRTDREKALIEDFKRLSQEERKLALHMEGEQGWLRARERLNDGLRAAPLGPRLKELKRLKAELAAREKALKEICSGESAAARALEAADKSLKDMEEDSTVYDDKKALIHLYRQKEEAYKGLEQAEKAVKESQSRLMAAEQAEKDRQSEYQKLLALIERADSDYRHILGQHETCLESYVAGITGELSRTLKEGEPCPVCGSTTHPAKAPISEAAVSRQQVERIKAQSDKAYKELQQLFSQRDKAEGGWKEARDTGSLMRQEALTARLEYESMEKNLVEGIGSLKALQKEEEALGAWVLKYDQDLKKVREAHNRAEKDLAAAMEGKNQALREAEASGKVLEACRRELERELSESGFKNEEEALSLSLEEGEISALNKEISDFEAKRTALSESLASIKRSLEGLSCPDEELCIRTIEETNKRISAYNEKKGSLKAALTRLEKKYRDVEKLGEGLEEALAQAEDDMEFARKLRGDSGTGLQRYVLGILFSTVISAANNMLEKVHNGRYRLFRSDDKTSGAHKKGLDLKVFDKNSSENGGRFVSTLSGGEKFLASLALSIGMSTVARKEGIRINALFIDEGFGSLDEDSIADAMDILAAIGSTESNGGIVGIISHVALLQERIPSKIRVTDTPEGSHLITTIG